MAQKESLEIGAKVLIHERVDDRVGNVVGEVEVEDDDVVGNKLENHEERREERHDEDDRHHKQHGRRLEVGQHHALRQAAALRRGNAATRTILGLFSRCLHEGHEVLTVMHIL